MQDGDSAFLELGKKHDIPEGDKAHYAAAKVSFHSKNIHKSYKVISKYFSWRVP